MGGFFVWSKEKARRFSDDGRLGLAQDIDSDFLARTRVHNVDDTAVKSLPTTSRELKAENLRFVPARHMAELSFSLALRQQFGTGADVHCPERAHERSSFSG